MMKELSILTDCNQLLVGINFVVVLSRWKGNIVREFESQTTEQ